MRRNEHGNLADTEPPDLHASRLLRLATAYEQRARQPKPIDVPSRRELRALAREARDLAAEFARAPQRGLATDLVTR